jgi:hypothetical protein
VTLADWVLPILLVAGGEIALGLFGLRVLWWVVRGWRAPDGTPSEPDGGGGLPLLVVIEGGQRRRAERRALRPAA